MTGTSPFSLEGKTILVTGASSGIGRSCAQMISAMGGRLILTARNESRLQETLTQLPGEGHSISPLDLLDNPAIEPWVEQLTAVDGVVHAAGVAKVVPFRMTTESHVDELMQVNFKAPVLLTQAMLRMKKIRPNASLVFITAVADHIAPAGTAVYAASKAALNAAVRSLALETAKHKIRANSVSPATWIHQCSSDWFLQPLWMNCKNSHTWVRYNLTTLQQAWCICFQMPHGGLRAHAWLLMVACRCQSVE